jgi:hypothetical protein
VDRTQQGQLNLLGRLEVDYTRNRVAFHPNVGEPFQLPLDPLDVDIARSLAEYAETKKSETRP